MAGPGFFHEVLKALMALPPFVLASNLLLSHSEGTRDPQESDVFFRSLEALCCP